MTDPLSTRAEPASKPSVWRDGPSPAWRWLDRLGSLGLPVSPLRIAGALCALAVAGVVGFLVLRPPPPPAEIVLPRATPGGSTGGSAQPSLVPPGSAQPGSAQPGPEPQGSGPQPPTVTVHAAGAVMRPGVYAVPTGARVVDVVGAAGGPRSDADLDRLNLAARVVDGDRVQVPRRGEPPGDPSAGGIEHDAGAGAGSAGPGSTPASSGPVDLNRATAEQLDSLPGVGPATAEAILAWRRAHGRFRTVSELLEVRGIGPAKLDSLRPLVRV